MSSLLNQMKESNLKDLTQLILIWCYEEIQKILNKLKDQTIKFHFNNLGYFYLKCPTDSDNIKELNQIIRRFFRNTQIKLLNLHDFLEFRHNKVIKSQSKYLNGTIKKFIKDCTLILEKETNYGNDYCIPKQKQCNMLDEMLTTFTYFETAKRNYDSDTFKISKEIEEDKEIEGIKQLNIAKNRINENEKFKEIKQKSWKSNSTCSIETVNEINQVNTNQQVDENGDKEIEFLCNKF